MAAERKGEVAAKEEEKKQDFAKSSITNFRERMLKEEMVSHSQEREH